MGNADLTAPILSRTNPQHRSRHARLRKRLDRLAEQIEPDRFNRSLSAQIDVVLVQLDALNEEGRR